MNDTDLVQTLVTWCEELEYYELAERLRRIPLRIAREIVDQPLDEILGFLTVMGY